MERANKIFVLVILVNILIPTHSLASETCQKEKDQVDYWNSLLKQRATEQRRDRHRTAKEAFLLCLGNNTSKQATEQRREVTTEAIRVSPPRQAPVRRSTNARVSSYHNFKGAKRIAWEAYFKESKHCINNKGNMSIFVQCSEQRKLALQYFNQLWDESAQKLRSPVK